ncbi:MAG: CoA transferase [Oscillospiraceae bacterium]|nr:CoA transferase [Oscillospiraceae bacterium]
MDKPLSGIKILDLTRAMAGPFCAMFLGDMGADVIKVEDPRGGDETRGAYPRLEGVATMFLSVNRNKRSITADLKNPEDAALVTELAKHADVLLENFRPGVAARLGLGYEALSVINPKLIYASCSGFGHTGPNKNLPAYDIVVQAYGGLMSVTGPKGQGPTKAGFSYGDIAAALFTATGVLAALCERLSSGRGQFVDVSMLDSQLAVSENALTRYLYEDKIPEPEGNRHPSIAPSDSFSASDGELMIVAGNDKLWRLLCAALKREDLTDDARFSGNGDRAAHHIELKAELERSLAGGTVEQWLEILGSAGVPCSPILGYEEAANHPQMKASNMLQTISQPGVGDTVMPGFPIRFSRTPCAVDRRPPLLGEHNEEVKQMLEKEYGYKSEIKA